MDVVGTIAAVVDLSTKLYEYIQKVDDAPKNISRLCTEISTLKGILEDIEFRRPSKNDPPKSALDSTLDDASSIVAQLLQQLSKDESSFRRKIRYLKWPFTEKDVAEDTKRLSRANQSLMLALIGELQSVPQDLIEIRAVNQETLQKVENIEDMMLGETVKRETKEQFEARQSVIKLLAPASPDERHREVCHAWRGSDPGAWFLNGAFKTWMEDSDPASRVMLLCGSSGSGKSTLLSSVVEHQKQKVGVDMTAYFYCVYNKVETQEVRNVLGSWAVQLSSPLPTALDEFQEEASRAAPVLISHLQDLIADLAKASPSVLLVLDALNESNEAGELAANIASIVDRSRNVRLLISSTSEGLLTARGCTCKRIDMMSAQTAQDIEVYVRQKIREHPALEPQDEDQIVEIIVPKSNGMFMWAKYQMEYLSSIPIADQVIEALDDLPSNLDDEYTLRLQRLLQLPTFWQTLVREALVWLSYSLRPLRLNELAEAMAYRCGLKHFGKRSRLPRPMDLLDMCQGLVRLDAITAVVSLAHSSVVTFLESDTIRSTSATYFALDEDRDERALLQKCLSYLQMDCFQIGTSCSRHDIRSFFRDYPLLHYAGNMWAVHARHFAIAYRLTQSELQLILDLFASQKMESGGHFAIWIRTILPHGSFDIIKRAQPLYYASSYGLAQVVDEMFSRGLVDKTNSEANWYLEAKSGRHSSTALQVAAYRGHIETVKVLLDHVANPNFTDEDGNTSIEWAYMRGHEEIYRLLLQARRGQEGPRVRKPMAGPEVEDGTPYQDLAECSPFD